jgi:thiosulfate/3-mercaptopyruvate sulfurtransferase
MRRSSLALFVVVSWLAVFPVAGQQVRNDMVVSPEWLGTHWSSVVLLDVSTGSEFTAGHIPTAVPLDLRRIVMTRAGVLNELPDVAELEEVFSAAGAGETKRIVLYARDLSVAARAWFTLDYLGHGHRTSILDGGLARWVAEGRRVTRETMPVARREFHALVHPETVTRLAQMHHLVQWRNIVHPRLVLIDSRPSEQYCGEDKGTGVVRAGRIPGAINVAWSENFTDDGTQTLHAADVLRETYAKAGVSAQSVNIVYCRTGMHASLTYFVLNYLGYDASLYDGSYIEWSAAENTIVVEQQREGGDVLSGPA